MVKVNIGCSGFMYNHWLRTFYPEEIPKRRWFEYYSGIFDTVELNVTFYRLPKAETFQKWYDITPKTFSFSLKGSRFITHIKRLNEPRDALKRFFDAVMNLKEKLSVILWQLPLGMKYEPGRFSDFISLLENYRVRNAFEFRHESWINGDTIDALKKSGYALCMTDWPEFNKEHPLTADFVYMRRHGYGGSYNTCYSREDLKKDARKIRDYLKKGTDVYIYFNNDANGYAPKNALELKELL